MPDDLPIFLSSVLLLVLYLLWSANTEMGTRPFRGFAKGQGDKSQKNDLKGSSKGGQDSKKA